MVWTLELASYLDDAPWPANKSELIDYATRSGAPQEVIENLEDLEEYKRKLIERKNSLTSKLLSYEELPLDKSLLYQLVEQKKKDYLKLKQILN